MPSPVKLFDSPSPRARPAPSRPAAAAAAALPRPARQARPATAPARVDVRQQPPSTLLSSPRAGGVGGGSGGTSSKRLSVSFADDGDAPPRSPDDDLNTTYSATYGTLNQYGVVDDGELLNLSSRSTPTAESSPTKRLTTATAAAAAASMVSPGGAGGGDGTLFDISVSTASPNSGDHNLNDLNDAIEELEHGLNLSMMSDEQIARRSV